MTKVIVVSKNFLSKIVLGTSMLQSLLVKDVPQISHNHMELLREEDITLILFEGG